VTAAAGITTLLITLGLVAGGWIRFTFFPAVESDYVAAMLTMPQGTPAEVTAEAVLHLEESAQNLRREIDGEERQPKSPVFRHIMASVGEQPYRSSQGGPGGGASIVGSHYGEVTLELSPSETRTVTSKEIMNRWRERNGVIPDAVELMFTSSIFSTGSPIDIQLSGTDLDELRGAADEVKRRLAEYPGVFDISDSFRAGKQEIKLDIQPGAESLGLTLADLARQVRQGFYGEEAQRVQRGRDDVKVMVRYPADERRSLGDLENMRVRTPAGGEVPFSSVALADFGRGYDVIRRTDRQRTVNVTADVDPTEGNANEILADLTRSVLPTVLADHRGVSYSFEGEQREQRDTMANLARGFLLALIVIYALMAIPFKSYSQPLIVMLAIPFGLVGAIWGHLIMGLNLTILSMFGLVALTGVVVNDSLVLVDFVNQRRRRGVPRVDALKQAGEARFRPILLTSLTTFAGLSPLLLERSVQAKFLVPMAVSLGFGVVFSTVITLVLVPSGYLILEDVKRLPRKLLGRDLPAEASRNEDRAGATSG
jgi:multidrug efflux pump subunit AcrB